MSRLLVNIDVPDLEAAIRFYTEALQLRVARRFSDAAVELVGFEVPIYLLRTASGSAPAAASTGCRSFDRHWTPIHLDLVVDDIHAAVRRATGAGARLEVPVQERGYGKLAVLADPFGHGLCFIEFVGAGYDAVATRDP